MIEKKLGKISRARFGNGGYDDAMFGASFTFDMKGTGVGDFWGFWPLSMKRSEHAKWQDFDRERHFVDMLRRIEEVMSAAKVRNFYDLVGVPVEVSIEGNQLSSWRVLTEVL